MSLLDPVRVETLDDRSLWWHLEVRRRLLRNEVLAKLYASQDPADRATIAAERALCQRDPAYWMDNYLWVKSPDEAGLSIPGELRDDAEQFNAFGATTPMVLWPRQRELIPWFLDLLRRGRAGLVAKSRKVGVSWEILALIYKLSETNRGFASLLLSRKEDLVDDTGERDRMRAAGQGPGGSSTDSLFGKIDYIHRCQPAWLLPQVEKPRRPMNFRFLETGSLITGESTNKGSGRGPRKSVVFIDEMPAMDTAVQDSIWSSTASTARCRIAVGTPGLPWCTFETLRKSLPAGSVFEMDWDSDPRRDADWKREQIEDLGGLERFLTEFGMAPITPTAGRVWRDVTSEGVNYREGDILGVEPDARSRWQVFGSWDFGSGPSDLVCFLWLLEFRGGAYHLWLDYEFTWKSERWQDAAGDVLDVLRSAYAIYGVHFGDPSGINRESDQESWITNLQAGGIPIVALPGSANTQQQREFQIKKVGALLANGTMRIHQRCTYALECVDRWTRHLAAGKTVESSSVLYIPPRHDRYSHGGTAMCFGIAGLLPVVAELLSGGVPTTTDYSYQPTAPGFLGDSGLALDDILAAM